MKKSSRRSSRPLVALAGVALAAYGFAKLRRNPQFFAGKVVVISGGSRGLGLVMARQLFAEGASLALLARDAEELAQAEADLTAGPGTGGIFTHVCDLTEPEQIKEAVAAVIGRFGRIDVLFNVAGMISVGPLAHMQLEDFEESMRLHFAGHLRMIWAVLPHLRQRRDARIVNVASIGGKIAVPHLSTYSVSKFALVGLSDALRTELAREGIKVSTVCPGLLRTGSQVHAEFKGQHNKEFDWFATSDNFPLAGSVSAEDAARQIIEAGRTGRPTLTFPLSARVLEIGAVLFPNLTAHALVFANRFLLPSPDAKAPAADANIPGRESRSMETTPGWKTSLIDRAAERNNELG